MKRIIEFFMTRTIGAFLFVLIGLIIGYWIFVKYLGYSNWSALIGFFIGIAIIIAYNYIKHKDDYRNNNNF